MHPFIQRSHDAKGAVHGTTAEIADQILRRGCRFACFADGCQRPGDGNIVDVMARRVRQRPLLPPARHAGVYKARVEREQFIRPQPQTLHHTWPETFDQHVGLGGGVTTKGLARIALQVNFGPVTRPLDNGVGDAAAGAINAHHVGAQISQQHGHVRPRPDSENSITLSPASGPEFSLIT